MKCCYLVISDPGNGLHGVHHTIDGAAHNAASLGAEFPPRKDAPYSVFDLIDELTRQPQVIFECTKGSEFERIRIECHAVVV